MRGREGVRCTTCPAFELANVGEGECRAKPPVMVGTPQGIGRMFPAVKSDDWCGLHPEHPMSKPPVSAAR